MKLTRRTVLAGASATGVLAGCGPRLELIGPFPLSVASGEVTHDTALLWTLYRGSSPLKVRVWREDETGTGFEGSAVVEEGGFVHVEATGLQSFTWHRFEFSDGAAQSPAGRFRTALGPGEARQLTFGAVSCLKQGFALDPLAHAARRKDLDAFFFLGDTVYADGARNLEGFRGKWSEGLSTPAHKALRASVSALHTWDDHELFNNWDAEQISDLGSFPGLRAFYEFAPLRRGADGQLWRSRRWGATAEVFVLDCRGERRPSSEEYISRAQLDWLKAGLANSPAAFKLILTSVPISSFPGAFFETTRDDRWQGYPRQRDELLGAIEDAGVRGVLWIAGDFHLASMGRVSANGRGSKAVEVLVGPGGQVPNASPSYPDRPQFDWASGINNYATFTLDPATVQADVKFFDGNGSVLTQRTYSL